MDGAATIAPFFLSQEIRKRRTRYNLGVQQPTQRQMDILKRLSEAGFQPIAIPPYESALCVRRGECAAVLAPVENGGLRILASPSFLVDGKFGVRVKRGERDVFVFKQMEVEATPERLRELAECQKLVDEILAEGATQ